MYRKTFGNESNRNLDFSLNVDTGLTYDLQRYTSSKFHFTLGVNAKVTNFMDISLSSTSENAVVYQYFRNVPMFSSSGTNSIPGERETNPFTDLINSFRFDQLELRQNSGFKLKTLNLDVVHHLGDWDAKLGLKLTPYKDDSNPQKIEYKFNPEISFTIQWLPIPEIKTEVSRDKDGFSHK
jgi:hypothetical protein